jgi:outer membrane usher protein FimD/PapC
VTEEDGRSTFQVSAESVPFLTRKGQVRYKLAAGKRAKTPRMTLKITRL